MRGRSRSSSRARSGRAGSSRRAAGSRCGVFRRHRAARPAPPGYAPAVLDRSPPQVRCVAALVLEQMPEILVSRGAEQPAARPEAGRELKVGEIGAAVAATQPILLLGEIVMADAGAMQLAQRLLGGTEIGGIAKRFCQMQRYAIDE